MPQHSNIATKSLYKTVDQIWFIAGDNSTDFNFYTKRIILATIYSSTLLYWNNHNNNLDKTTEFLDKQLTKVSKIPIIKNKIKKISTFLPQTINIIKKIIPARQ